MEFSPSGSDIPSTHSNELNDIYTQIITYGKKRNKNEKKYSIYINYKENHIKIKIIKLNADRSYTSKQFSKTFCVLHANNETLSMCAR